MLLTLTMGGDWAGAINSSTPLPAKFLVDYVRAYSMGSGSTQLQPSAATFANPQSSVTDSVPLQTITSTSGSHTYFLNGNYETLNATGTGTQTVTVTGSGATITLGSASDQLTL